MHPNHRVSMWRRAAMLVLSLPATVAIMVATVALAQMAGPMTTATTEGIVVPTPSGWIVEETEPALRMTREDPTGEIAVASVTAADAETAILAALRAWFDPRIDAAFVEAPTQTSPANLPTGTWTQRIYLHGEEILAALTLERGETIYLVIARGTQAAFMESINAAVGEVLIGMDLGEDAGPGEPSAVSSEAEATDDAFATEDVALDLPVGTLRGTLLLPAGVEHPPVALIVAGSGPTDRDGNSPLLEGRNDSLKLLAEDLARDGVASLRYDKRGVAGSAGALAAEEDVRFEDFVADAVAWLELLAADERLGDRVVIGHSEGSLIGMLAAEEAGASAFVSVAGPGRSAADLLRTQLAAQLPAPLLEEATDAIATLEAGETLDEVSAELASLFRPSVQPYLISWFAYDPAEAIARLEMPVLIVQGTTDIQVAVAEAELLAAADPDAELSVIEDMNHVLKEVPEGEDPLASYGDPSLPLAEGLVDAIATFVNDAVRAD